MLMMLREAEKILLVDGLQNTAPASAAQRTTLLALATSIRRPLAVAAAFTSSISSCESGLDSVATSSDRGRSTVALTGLPRGKRISNGPLLGRAWTALPDHSAPGARQWARYMLHEVIALRQIK